MSPLSSLSLVIRSLGFLVMSHSSLWANFLHSLLLEAPEFGSIFLESFFHTSLVSPFLFTFVFASSNIWKQTVSYCASISSLKSVKFSNLSAEFSFSTIFSASSDRIFLAPVSRSGYPFIPVLAMNFPDHIHHFYFSPLNGDNPDSLFVHSCTFLYFLIDFSPNFESSCDNSKYCHVDLDSSLSA